MRHRVERKLIHQAISLARESARVAQRERVFELGDQRDAIDNTNPQSSLSSRQGRRIQTVNEGRAHRRDQFIVDEYLNERRGRIRNADFNGKYPFNRTEGRRARLY
jgi:hypothetical protein